MDLTDIFTRLAERNQSDALGKTRDRWGIGTAAVYLRQIESAVKGSMSEAKWQKALSEAERQLTFCDPDMRPVDIDVNQMTGKEAGVGFDVVPFKSPSGEMLHVLQLKKKRTPVEGSILEFDAVVTSNSEDRDRDVLEPKGDGRGHQSRTALAAHSVGTHRQASGGASPE